MSGSSNQQASLNSILDWSTGMVKAQFETLSVVSFNGQGAGSGAECGAADVITEAVGGTG